MKKLCVLAAVLCLLTTAGCGRIDPGMDESDVRNVVTEMSDSMAQNDYLYDDPRFMALSADEAVLRSTAVTKDESGKIVSRKVTEYNKYDYTLSSVANDYEKDLEETETYTYRFNENHDPVYTHSVNKFGESEEFREYDDQGNESHYEYFKSGKKVSEITYAYNEKNELQTMQIIDYDDDGKAAADSTFDYSEKKYDDRGNTVHSVVRKNGGLFNKTESLFDAENNEVYSKTTLYDDDGSIIKSTTSRFEYDPVTGEKSNIDLVYEDSADGELKETESVKKSIVYDEHGRESEETFFSSVDNRTLVTEYEYEYLCSDELAEMFMTKTREKPEKADAAENAEAEQATKAVNSDVSADAENGYLEDDPRFIEISDTAPVYRIRFFEKDDKGNLIYGSISEHDKYDHTLSYKLLRDEDDDGYNVVYSYEYDENHRTIRYDNTDNDGKNEWVCTRDENGRIIHDEHYDDGKKTSESYTEYNEYGDKIKKRYVDYYPLSGDTDQRIVESITYYERKYDDNGNNIYCATKDQDGKLKYENEYTYDKDNKILTSNYKVYNEKGEIAYFVNHRYKYDPVTGEEIFRETTGRDEYSGKDIHEQCRTYIDEKQLYAKVERIDLVKNETSFSEYYVEYLVSDELAEMFETKERKKPSDDRSGTEYEDASDLSEFME